jgi:hypothetical protein
MLIFQRSSITPHSSLWSEFPNLPFVRFQVKKKVDLFRTKKVSAGVKKVSEHGVEQTFRSAVNGPQIPFLAPQAVALSAWRGGQYPRAFLA